MVVEVKANATPHTKALCRSSSRHSSRTTVVVSTGARSAERRDLVSTIGSLLLREGPSARHGVYPERSRGGLWSGRRKSFAAGICDSPAASGAWKRSRIGKHHSGETDISRELEIERAVRQRAIYFNRLESGA